MGGEKCDPCRNQNGIFLHVRVSVNNLISFSSFSHSFTQRGKPGDTTPIPGPAKKPAKKDNPPKQSKATILTDMARNIFECFAGFGRHTINDFLFLAGIFPGTPSWYICEDNDRYLAFFHALVSYLARYEEPEFLKGAVSIANTENPFDFNDYSHVAYLAAYIFIFRRVRVCHILHLVFSIID